jgi:hypothetical protein
MRLSRWARQRAARQPEVRPDGLEELRRPVSPYAAGLTDNKDAGWHQYLREEFGIETAPDGEPRRPEPQVPAPRRPESEDEPRSGELRLVSIPFPGDGRARASKADRARDRQPPSQDLHIYLLPPAPCACQGSRDSADIEAG